MSRTLAFPPCFALEPRRLARGKLQHGAMGASSTPSSLSKTADNPPLKTPANRQEPILGQLGRSHTDLGREAPPAPGRPEITPQSRSQASDRLCPFSFSQSPTLTLETRGPWAPGDPLPPLVPVASNDHTAETTHVVPLRGQAPSPPKSTLQNPSRTPCG